MMGREFRRKETDSGSFWVVPMCLHRICVRMYFLCLLRYLLFKIPAPSHLMFKFSTR